MLTKADVYAAYDTGIGYIKLENRGLTLVPDLCMLLDSEDHSKIIALNLSNNKIRVVNRDLSCLTNLQSLNISYNQIEVVQTLGSLPSLIELRLHQNEIKTTKGFPNFPALQNLSLAFNQLKEVEDISHLKNLVVLELHHNLLEKIDGIEQLEKLEQLKLEFNKLKDGEIRAVADQLEKLSLLTAKGNELKEDLLNRLDGLNQLRLQKNLLGGTSASGTVMLSGEVAE